MGGTTAKACLIKDGEVETTIEYEVGGAGSQSRWVHGTGHPIRVPVIDLAEVSAGGGSIAWIDPAGSLQVGPRSAGADPGPVCYGRGGTEPTVTDANLVLGYLDTHSLLGGRMSIDYDAASAALEEKIGRPLKLSVVEAAAAIVRIVNNAMAEALRIVSIERGHDPRDLDMVAFGGAGGLHAAALAEELGIPGIVIPPIPGGFSALGLIGTDIRRDYVRTLYAPLDKLAPGRLADVWGEMEEQGREMLTASGVKEQDWQLKRSVGLRYTRQAYDLTIPAPDGEVSQEMLEDLEEAFDKRHLETYGHRNPGEPVTLVTARITAVGKMPRFAIAQRAPAKGDSLKGERVAFFPGSERDLSVRVHDRARMAQDATITGPAVIESLDSTIVIPPGWQTLMDGQGFLRMKRSVQ
jgi:N-methylhydantoinase A